MTGERAGVPIRGYRRAPGPGEMVAVREHRRRCIDGKWVCIYRSMHRRRCNGLVPYPPWVLSKRKSRSLRARVREEASKELGRGRAEAGAGNRRDIPPRLSTQRLEEEVQAHRDVEALPPGSLVQCVRACRKIPRACKKPGSLLGPRPF